MTVFDTTDYKEFLRGWVETRPGGGRGEYRKMAAKLGVSTTLISQVVNGDKHFSPELANELCEHLALADREADHFLLLIEYARAGTHKYRQRLKRRVDAARIQALKISERLERDRELTETESATYYSHWSYTGITNLIAVDPKLNVDSLAERLKIPRHLAAKVLNFLIESGIVLNRGGGLEVGVKKTHLSADSPLVVKHHQNWRMRGFDKMPFSDSNDLFYTAPMSLSEEVAAQVSREIGELILKVVKLVGPSQSEVARCLNIDWFNY